MSKVVLKKAPKQNPQVILNKINIGASTSKPKKNNKGQLLFSTSGGAPIKKKKV